MVQLCLQPLVRPNSFVSFRQTVELFQPNGLPNTYSRLGAANQHTHGNTRASAWYLIYVTKNKILVRWTTVDCLFVEYILCTIFAELRGANFAINMKGGVRCQFLIILVKHSLNRHCIEMCVDRSSNLSQVSFVHQLLAVFN
jgi:hypothetical protein